MGTIFGSYWEGNKYEDKRSGNTYFVIPAVIRRDCVLLMHDSLKAFGKYIGLESGRYE